MSIKTFFLHRWSSERVVNYRDALGVFHIQEHQGYQEYQDYC